MIGWLLVTAFGIIWITFLLPTWRRSPTSTVEQFEERMSLLAEANRATPGRWVLVPKKGHRFLGPQDRQRARLRRRRKFLFVALLDLIGLTLIMGLFQPLRAMLVLTAVLCGVLVLYVGLLLRFRLLEGRVDATSEVRIGAYAEHGNDHRAYANGNGQSVSVGANGNGHANGNGNGSGNGNGNGHHDIVDEGYLPMTRYLGEGAIQIVDEDVHVIVRRSDEIDLRALRAANGSSAE
jgi:hypothetical protein